MLYGSYFACDSIGALGPLLIRELGIDRSDLGLLYGVYSWPNVFMVFIGGLLADRLGLRRASLLLSGLILVGVVGVALAPSLLHGRAVFWAMVAGRTLFGLGAESLAICQNAMIARWFHGRQLAFAFSMTLTMARLGSLVSYRAEADIAARYGGFGAGLWAAALFCLFSAVCTLLYVVLDRRAALPEPSPDPASGAPTLALGFDKRFYMLAAYCVFFYSAFFPFTGLATDFLTEKWNFSAAAAGRLTSLLTALTIVLSPLIGGFLDRGLGRRPSSGDSTVRSRRSGRVLLFAAGLLAPAYLLLGLTGVAPLPLFVVLGLAFSLAPAALWPQIPSLVPPQRVATAYGLTTMLQSIGLAAVPWVSGALRDATTRYTASMLMFAAFGLVSTAIAWWLLRQRPALSERAPASAA